MQTKNPFALQKKVDELEQALARVQTVAWSEGTEDGAASYVQNRVEFALATTTVGEVCDIEDPNSVKRCIDAYFAMCKVNSTDPTLPGLANALGRSTSWLKNFRNAGSTGSFSVRPLKAEVKEEINKACRVLDQLFAQLIIDGKVAPAAASILGTQHYEYVNKIEHKIENVNRAEQVKTVEDIANEFDKLPPIEDVEYTEVE